MESVLKRKNFHRRISQMEIFDKCADSEKFLLQENDILIPWTITNKNIGTQKKPRIYHLYTYSALQIYYEFFNCEMIEIKNLGENPGINYFLLLSQKN